MLYLGVDSGGTKAAFLLADETGRVIARHREPGCTALSGRKAGVKRMLENGIAAICAKAQIQKETIAMLGLGALLGVALAVMQYRRVTASVGDRRDRIVAECPRFANYLTQNLATQNRDLLGMLSAYQRTATCPDFAEEIAQTVADMKTGNYERALFNLQHRVDHPSMTEIVRGLQGVLHGDDQTMYFERVCFDMKNLEQALLRKEAAKRPRKITKYQFAIMAGTILMMAVARVTQLLDSLQVLFQ